MSETDELAKKLAHRNAVNEGEAQPEQQTIVNVYTEFPNFSRKEMKQIEKIFKTYDADNNKFLDMLELKLLMEKVGSPQTHLGLKAMIKEVDQDLDGQISFREFCLIYKKARDGDLECEGLKELCKLTEVDVDEVGVGGAKDFFEAKIKEQGVSSKFEEEIKAEQEERKTEMEEAKVRKQAFKEKQQRFN